LQDLSPEEYEVIVVDDASSDDTPEVVRSFQERAKCSVRLRRKPNLCREAQLHVFEIDQLLKSNREVSMK